MRQTLVCIGHRAGLTIPLPVPPQATTRHGRFPTSLWRDALSLRSGFDGHTRAPHLMRRQLEAVHHGQIFLHE